MFLTRKFYLLITTLVFKYLHLRETKARFNITATDLISSTSKRPFHDLGRWK